MISYLPEIYPDELIYSWFCRIFVHSGAVSHAAVLNDILYKRCNNLNKEFFGHLNPKFLDQINEMYSINALTMKHTMFPQYGRFLSASDKSNAFEHLSYQFRDVHTLFSIPPRAEEDRFLKYCPLCSKNDREIYGEAYWHRTHQLRGAQVCTKHGCALLPSCVTVIGSRGYSFFPAEQYINSEIIDDIKIAAMLPFGQYLEDVFHTTMDLTRDGDVAGILHSKMMEKGYTSACGTVRKMEQFTRELTEYYASSGIATAGFSVVQKVLHGTQVDFLTICQIAHFLGITANELTQSNGKALPVRKKRDKPLDCEMLHP